MSKDRKALGCDCGQVSFDTTERKVDDVLSCPWCQRQYQFLGDDKIRELSVEEHKSLLARKQTVSAEQKKKKGEGEVTPAADEKGQGGIHVVAGSEEVLLSEHDEAPRPVSKRRQSLRNADPAAQGESRRSQSQTSEVPGGVFRMIAFIIIFNGLAFVALALLMPQQPDKSRLALWGTVAAKGAIWPELVTLLIGHFLGFIAWSFHIYRLQLQGKLNLERPRSAAFGPAEGKAHDER